MNKAMRVKSQHLPSTSSHDSGPSQSRNLAVDQGHRINFLKRKTFAKTWWGRSQTQSILELNAATNDCDDA
jgi:hypothetical protein